MDNPITIEQELDAANATIAELQQAIKDPSIVAANARADAAELVAGKLTDQLASATAERDSLVNEVAKLKANYKSAELQSAIIVASCGVDALKVSNHARPSSTGNGSRADAVAELEAASKQGPEAFAAAYKRVGKALVG